MKDIIQLNEQVFLRTLNVTDAKELFDHKAYSLLKSEWTARK